MQYGSVDRAVEGNVVAQVPRDEAQPPPVAAADRTLQAPANTGEEPGPQQAGLAQALTTMEPGRHPDPGSVLSGPGSGPTPEFLTPRSRITSQGQGNWLGRNVMEGAEMGYPTGSIFSSTGRFGSEPFAGVTTWGTYVCLEVPSKNKTSTAPGNTSLFINTC